MLNRRILSMSAFVVLALAATPCFAAGGDPMSSQALIAMVITQAIAFYLLFLILKKFAFGPVLNVLDSRRDRIASDFKAIEDGNTALEGTKKDLADRLDQIEDEARIKIRDGVQEGQDLSEKLKAEAQGEANEMLDKARGLIESERAKAAVEMRDQLVDLTMAATEKIIRESLTRKKHQDIIDDFIENMPTAS
ncbi:MAG: F0F1 ATP synthase subunit B [Planctomycetota bacterium]|jgi:F-type H+-transporting ATPase subunit b|nr:F0F1 ATP synthase subunit B [Planctomycetota bacterium]